MVMEVSKMVVSTETELGDYSELRIYHLSTQSLIYKHVKD